MYVKGKLLLSLSHWKGIFGLLSLEGAGFGESTGGCSFMVYATIRDLQQQRVAETSSGKLGKENREDVQHCQQLFTLLQRPFVNSQEED